MPAAFLRLPTLRRCRGAALALAALLAAEGAAAQSAISSASRDQRRDRQLLLPGGATPEPTPELGFALDLVLPVLWTDSAFLDGSTDVAPLKRGSLEIAPDLLFRAGRLVGEELRLAGQAGITLHRFGRADDADFDVLYGGVEAAWTPFGSDRLVPYAGYDATLEAGRGFDPHLDTLHDFYVGVWSATGLAPDGSSTDYSAAVEPGALALGVDFNVTRRLAHPDDLYSVYADLTLEATYVLTPTLGLTLLPRLRLHWFDDFFGGFRRDTLLSGGATLSWRPDWLTALNSRAELGFTLLFQRNWSTLEGASFTDWTFGPAVALGWRF